MTKTITKTGRLEGLVFGSLVLALSVAGLPGSSAADRKHRPTPECDEDFFQSAAPEDTTIVSAVLLEDPVQYCRVDGFVTTQDPGPNQVNFAVSLPTEHNGRFYFQGLGGTAGSVPDPSPELLSQGYAWAVTDTGNQTALTGGLDYSIIADPALGLDHDHRGGHVATVAAQQMTRAYYRLKKKGRKRLYTYHSGCSGGGRMGWSAAVWYPDDYDGIVAGAVGRGVGNMLHFGKVGQFILQNIDTSVEPAIPDVAISFATAGLALQHQFDAADGALDGHIWDPSVVDISDAELDALLAPITPNWRHVVDLIRDGYDIGGLMQQPAYPISAILHNAIWLPAELPPPFGSFLFPSQIFGSFARGNIGGAYTTNESYVDLFDFDSLEDEAAFVEPMQGIYQLGAQNGGSDLRAFGRAGHKMIIWHGVHDPVISWNAATVIYDEVVEDTGSLKKTQKFARLLPVPGIAHCGGGDGPSDTAEAALKAVERWVEKGQAPRSVVATREDDGRTYRLCPYPARSVFRGGLDNPRGLDVNDAKNWTCVSVDRHDRDHHDRDHHDRDHHGDDD